MTRPRKTGLTGLLKGELAMIDAAEHSDAPAQAGLSLQKQRIFTKYATGRVSWQDAAREIAQLRPPAVKRRWLGVLATLALVITVVVLVPPWAKRGDYFWGG